jgi:uncharacterized protein (TIGR00730 family)
MANDITGEGEAEQIPPQQLVPPQPINLVPPVPLRAANTMSNSTEHHEVMGQVLTQAIQQGKRQVPNIPDPLVMKPADLESWRVFKIMSEFVEGFELLKKYGLAATFFGTARNTFEPHFYEEASALAGKLATTGFAIITGGGSGIMGAANKGAFEAGGASIGLNIRLSKSQGLNQYVTDSITFEHFFVRKVMLTFASEVYIYFPGGFGTLDEFFEIITLVQTNKIRKVPIILYGKEYWLPLIAFFKTKMYGEHHAIDEADMDLYFVADSVDEAYEYIIKNVVSV